MLSSVDNQTATDILNNLSQGTQRKTVIFISHQLSAAATVHFFVMDKGCQSGTHVELYNNPVFTGCFGISTSWKKSSDSLFVGADFINKTVIQLFPHLSVLVEATRGNGEVRCKSDAVPQL